MHEDAGPRKAVRSPSATIPLIALVIANIALAFGPWFVRMADTGPVAAAFWRVALATPVLLGAAILLGQRPFAAARGRWWVLGLSGLAFALDLGSWHLGIHQTSLANATLLGNSATFIFPIYGFIISRAWPSRGQAVALGLAAAGTGVLLGRSAELSAANLVGDLLCLVAGVLYAVYFILMARVRDVMAPLPALALSSAAGILPLWLFALALGERMLPGDWGPVVLLVVVSQLIGQGLMIYALGHLSPLVVGIALLIQPAVAATIGWWVYEERPGALDWAGMLLIALALVLVRRNVRPPVQLAPVGARSHNGSA